MLAKDNTWMDEKSLRYNQKVVFLRDGVPVNSQELPLRPKRSRSNSNETRQNGSNNRQRRDDHTGFVPLGTPGTQRAGNTSGYAPSSNKAAGRGGPNPLGGSRYTQDQAWDAT